MSKKWSFEKPTKPGDYYLSLAPAQRKGRFAPVCDAFTDGTGEVWIGDTGEVWIGDTLIPDERLTGAQWADRKKPADPFTPIHACSPEGSGNMPCCGCTPFEKVHDRITDNPLLVTCGRK